jgi:hypothetical protein
MLRMLAQIGAGLIDKGVGHAARMAATGPDRKDKDSKVQRTTR